jgi:hypothetical protein
MGEDADAASRQHFQFDFNANRERKKSVKTGPPYGFNSSADEPVPARFDSSEAHSKALSERLSTPSGNRSELQQRAVRRVANPRPTRLFAEPRSTPSTLACDITQGQPGNTK